MLLLKPLQLNIAREILHDSEVYEVIDELQGGEMVFAIHLFIHINTE